MKVYKFGGASVRSAEGVRNLAGIVGMERGPLFVIVSAMGKTTNALETVTELFVAGDRQRAREALGNSRACHEEICEGLFPGGGLPQSVAGFFDGLEDIIDTAAPDPKEYDYWYDRIVSCGQLISTSIVAAYLEQSGMRTKWIDIRRCFVTDARHRDANVDIACSAPLLLGEVRDSGADIFVSQGFIGTDEAGQTTTLGREGSDYSAAVAANILDAESLTIWKDVRGVMNGDPKIFPDAVYIPELTYLDAIELAYGGAQIIHPKTIKPLQNKDIPLYVRSFAEPSAPGSVIRREMDGCIEVPILILKHDQVLLSIRPNDFSFVLEDRFSAIFSLLERHGVKINLIQSSAVNLSLSVDDSRHLPEVVEELRSCQFRVVYNNDMQLLTIRGYTTAMLEKYASGSDIYLTQKTRRTLRIVRRMPAGTPTKRRV